MTHHTLPDWISFYQLKVICYIIGKLFVLSEAPNAKRQITNKLQSPKSKPPHPALSPEGRGESRLRAIAALATARWGVIVEIGTWNLFGIWNLSFGILK